MSTVNPFEGMPPPSDGYQIDADGLLRTTILKNRYEQNGFLTVINLAEGDVLHIDLMAASTHSVDPDRIIEATYFDQDRALFRITADTWPDSHLTDRLVNLGSISRTDGVSVSLQETTINSLIIPGAGLAMDYSGNQFFSDKSDNKKFPLHYTGLRVNGVEFF